MRDRLRDKDQQTHFAKKHYSLGSNAYLTDIDGMEAVSFNTENASYQQYDYFDNKPFVTKFIEVKYKLTDYLIKMIKKEKPTNGQILVFANTVNEINGFRQETGKPKAKFYLVIENEGKFPHYVFDVSFKDKEIHYDYLGQVRTTQEYVDIFSN